MMQPVKRWRPDDDDSQSFGEAESPPSSPRYNRIEIDLQPLHGQAPIDNLSADVLQVIFSFIPTRPRILVVARACRLWRTAALSTITSFPSTADPQRAVTLLPALSSYTATTHDKRPVVIPPGISDLTVADCIPCACACAAFVQQAAALVSLSRLDMQRSSCGCVLTLLRASERTLADLSLVLQCATWSAEMYKALSAIPLYSLRRLNLQLIEPDQAAYHHVPLLLTAISHQLQYLALSYQCSVGNALMHELFLQVATCNFPRLTALRLDLGHIPCLAVVTKFLARTPQLCSLELSVSLCDPDLPQLLSRYPYILTSLSLFDCEIPVGAHYLTQLHIRLAQCRNITSIALHGAAPEALWSPMAHRVTFMTHVPTNSLLLRSLIRLTHLEFSSPGGIGVFPYLPALRFIAFDLTQYPYALAITTLNNVLRFCRRLLTLRLFLPHISQRRLAALTELLRRAERAGVELVEMRSPLARVQNLRHDFLWLAIQKQPVQQYAQEDIDRVDELTDKADADAEHIIEVSEKGGLSIGRRS